MTFKFLRNPLVYSYDEQPIYDDEWFYSINKETMTSPRSGKIIPKYTIVTRIVLERFRHKFKPDHKALWYFKTKESAYRFIDYCKGYDEWELKMRRRRTR
jgi:hypothetical protein